MDNENTVDTPPPLTRNGILAANIFADLKVQLANRYAFQADVWEREQQIESLSKELAIKDAENSELSRQVALSGEIIAHVKEVCAADRDLMEFIESRLKSK